MSDNQALEFERERIEKEAADWVGKLDRGISAAEEDALLDWIAIDPRHGECLAELKGDWDEFDALDEWRPVDSKLPNPDLLKRSLGLAKGGRLAAVWMGSAAAVAVVGFVALFVSRTSSMDVSRDLAPGDFAVSYERHVLEDGSTVELNRGAQVAVWYSVDERRLELVRGEAHFSVARDPNRPFVVAARNAQVVAVGTVFSVKLESRSLEVLVTEGTVNFEPLDREAPLATESPDTALSSSLPVAQLEAGQRAVQNLDQESFDPRIYTVSTAELATRLAWKDGILDMDSRPLSEVVSEFNRHNHTQIVIGDDELLDLKVTVALKPDNHAGFVRLLEMTADVEADDRGNGTIILRKK